MNSFSKLGIKNSVLKAIKRNGWTEPTEVQTEAIPVGLEGKDILVQAQTGTGKTGTFGSIILSTIEAGYGIPSALIIVPTRELALQITEEIVKLSYFSGHKCVPVYGGANIDKQVTDLKNGADIVVGTPGRLRDLLEKKSLRVSKIKVSVLDEADRMLDMGFARDLNYILTWLPKKRQNMMFSATMPNTVKNLALERMKDPVELLISKDEIVLDLIEQRYMVLDKDSKKDALCTILDKEGQKTIVFMKMKHRCTQLGRKMRNTGYDVGILHGDIVQNKRERTIREFRDGKLNVLIATDVAARGLDIDDVGIVVNYDMTDRETYVHRIGRTGRAGKRGIAYTFILDADEEKELLKIAKSNGVEIARTDMELVHHEARTPPKKDPTPVRKQSDVPCQNKKERKKTPKGTNRPRSFKKIRINLGKYDDIDKGDIVEFIRISSGIKNTSIGRMDMRNDHTLIEIDSDVVEKVRDELCKYDFDGKQIVVELNKA